MIYYTKKLPRNGFAMISSQDDWNDWYPSLKDLKKKCMSTKEKAKYQSLV